MSLSPYFQSLNRQKRICPECLKHTLRIEELPVPADDMATEVCDGCGYFCIIDAPAGAAPSPKPEGARIIQLDFNRRG